MLAGMTTRGEVRDAISDILFDDGADGDGCDVDG